MKQQSVGAACFLGLLVSATGLMLHWFELSSAEGRALTRWAGAFCLFWAPLFPIYALVSPEPANGPKLLVFPAATMVAMAPFLPSAGAGGVSTRSLLTGILIFAMCANAIVPFLPRATNGLVGSKTIRWSAGGKLMLAVAILGIAVAVADRLIESSRGPAPGREPSSPAYRFASWILLVVFSFFLQSRFTQSPRAILAGLAAAIGAAALFTFRIDPAPVQRIPDSRVAGLALALGALYSLLHAARTGSVVWTLVAAALGAGAARTSPFLAIGLLLGFAVASYDAVRARQWTGLVECILVIVLTAAMVPVWPPLPATFHLPDVRFEFFAMFVPLACAAAIGFLRMRGAQSARALLWCSIAWVWVSGLAGPGTFLILGFPAWWGFALIAGTVLAPRAGASTGPADSGSFA